MNKKMMMCMMCGFSQLSAPTDLICTRCGGPLVLSPQEHVNAFRHLGEYSELENQRRIDAENHKRERGVI